MLAIIVCAVVACTDSPLQPQAPDLTRVLPEWVTGDAATALGPDGRFRLPSVNPRVMTRQRAESLALGIARWLSDPDLAGNLRAYVEEQHGGPIDFLGLRSCGRSLYQQPVLQTPDGPDDLIRHHAAQWVIPLCEPSRLPGLIVEIPDAPTAMTIDPQGRLQLGPSGTQLYVQGGHPGAEEGLALTPEQAVAFVFAATRQRVTRVPEMLMRFDSRRWAAPCARWHVELEAPVQLSTATSGDITLKEVFVYSAPSCLLNSQPTFAVPLADQPDSITLQFLGPANPPLRDSTRVAVIAPIVFEDAVLGSRTSLAWAPDPGVERSAPSAANELLIRNLRGRVTRP
jgi:hypothetical protein